MYRATIAVHDVSGIIRKCFAAEDKDIKGRAHYTLRGNENLVFEISAADSSGLRTVLNSITKMLTVIEKTKGIR
ncbi:hypothetical protein HYX10_02900 [Candidatus Woesearchaeota archaeon]|nr:hypothetical protein [Candidatus Woesearchaeota archaeon]